MNRIKFSKGEQRKFLDSIIEKTNSPSLRGLLQFGLSIKYSTLKNYYNESRFIGERLFNELIEISGISKASLSFETVKSNWGQIKGGKIGKR